MHYKNFGCDKVTLPKLSQRVRSPLLPLTFLVFPWTHAAKITLQSVDCTRRIVTLLELQWREPIGGIKRYSHEEILKMEFANHSPSDIIVLHFHWFNK